MKKHILPAIKLTLVLIVFFAVIYPIAVWGMAQFSSNKGKGDTVEFKGKKYY
ncbi:potassium-transporting ATPase subunit C [Sphingobacterium sp.]|uniref:potassium-transporting ATPase subunit C n=1 Tax=Sphingobacterium sp. TaxID=341027 RepID=UPI00289AC796|nr:potassium-transporting ATPase subunit C [Sphingobacterium sp.]